MTGQPLKGIRVLEVGHMLAGPYCGMILSDLGAEVIKLEAAEGDISRHLGSHNLGPHNLYFASLNRGKRSITLDLGQDESRGELARLVSSSHALITNLRPSAIRRLGLTYADLRQWNDKIVCLALTGFGLDGPYADRPAYDYVIQAMTGVMTLTGDPDSPPTKAGYSAVDNSSGIMGAVGILAKIVEGSGGQIDISLHDVMLSQLNYIASAYLNAGERPARRKGGAHPFIVPAQIFSGRSGYLALFITHDAFWRKFAVAVRREDWLTEPAFATMEARAAHRVEVISAIEALIRTEDADYWVNLLAPHGIVVASVSTLDDALESDIVRERRMIATVPTVHGPLRMVSNPIRFDGQDISEYGQPPLLGEANQDFMQPP